MNHYGIAHEAFMNRSGTILPRVGVGVGVGGGWVGHPCLSSYRRKSRPVDNATAAATPDRLAWMAAPRQIGGESCR